MAQTICVIRFVGLTTGGLVCVSSGTRLSVRHHSMTVTASLVPVTVAEEM